MADDTDDEEIHSDTGRPPGQDTPTGTDPDAKYEEPGFEDKSLGQAVEQDQELVDELLEESDSREEAERRFQQESAGSPQPDDDAEERND